MVNSCGNCKYKEYREGYLYPYRCRKDKAVSYTEEAWMDKAHCGYICKNWEPKKGETNE